MATAWILNARRWAAEGHGLECGDGGGGAMDAEALSLPQRRKGLEDARVVILDWQRAGDMVCG